MASNVTIVLFMLCLVSFMSFDIILCVLGHDDNINASIYETQLKILNKPPIKTIEAEDGNIFDCVAITKQPALDHPLLKDHIIQAKPSSFGPRKENISSSRSNGSLLDQVLFETMIECPVGTVPIQRTTKKHLIRARFLLHDSKKPDRSRQAVVSLIMKPSFRMYGAGGRVSMQNLALSSDQFSSSNIWIQSGPSKALNYITAGWMVSPELYGDSRTRLFTFWTGDGSRKTGCFNTLCPGFVQIDRRITPTTLVGPASKYNGPQFDFKVQVFQDRKTGNWWFLVSDGTKDVHVGYWPSKLFPYMRVGTTQVGWGGIAQAAKTGISPPMGNGRFPNGDYRRACYFSNVHYVDHKNTMVSLGNQKSNQLFQEIDKPKCYGLKNSKLMNTNMGYSFTFGGPGGKCG